MPPKPFSIIVAATRQLGIGSKGGLPWRLPKEMEHFLKTTSRACENKRNAVIMGRKTWESIPLMRRPLSKRLNIVITSKPTISNKDYTQVGSFEEALQVADHEDIDQVFVIGGAQVYETALKHPQCKHILFTRILDHVDCDTFFPKFEHVWSLEHVSDVVTEFNLNVRPGVEMSFQYEQWSKVHVDARKLRWMKLTDALLETQMEQAGAFGFAINPQEVNQIEDRLYLGSLIASRDQAWLQRAGITHILSVMRFHSASPQVLTDPKGCFAENYRLKDDWFDPKLRAVHRITEDAPGTSTAVVPDMKRMQVPIDDSLDEMILIYFDPCYRWINQALEHGGTVLVHCHAGISRSTSIVCSYLMRKHDLSVQEALQLIRKNRPRVNPNSNFMRQLHDQQRHLRESRTKLLQLHLQEQTTQIINDFLFS